MGMQTCRMMPFDSVALLITGDVPVGAFFEWLKKKRGEKAMMKLGRGAIAIFALLVGFLA